MESRKRTLKKRICVILGLLIIALLIVLLIVMGIIFGEKEYQNNDIQKKVDNNEIKYSEEIYFKPTIRSKVSHIPDKSIEYVENELIIDVMSEVSYEEVKNLMENYNAYIVGYIGVTNTYQIELQNELTYDELLVVKEKLEKENYIDGVYLNKIYPVNNFEGYYPNDSEWIKEWTGTVRGKNWALEFMNIPEAWHYMKNVTEHTPQEAKVGIFEVSGIDYKHEDLQDNFIEVPLGNIKDKEDKKHGTAVAGIIGAGFDNAIGLTGIIPDVKLCAVSYNGISDYYPNDQIGSMFYRVALAYLMSLDKEDYKTTIINASLGCETLAFAASRRNTEAIETLDELNGEIGRFLEILLNKGYDFLICKSAGNNNESFGKDKRYYYVRADADDENAICGYIEASDEKAKKYKKYDDYESRLDYGNVDAQYDVFSGITNSKIKDRIIVVGSIGVSKDNNFYASEYSCSGPRVDILAPGEEIYVLEPDDKYSDEGSWGTSWSAPYVSGAAGLMLSLNPELSGKELKDLLIDSATGQYTGVLHDQAYNYQAVNANVAVRYADVYAHDSAYKWTVDPTIEADNIYYLNSNDAWEVPVNMLNKQMEKNYGYAVIKKGDDYGLIDMDGNLLDGMNFQSVDTKISRYHIIYKEPHYDSMTGTETTKFNLYDDGLSFAFGHGDASYLHGGVYFWNDGLMQYYLANKMPEPDDPIAVCESSELLPDTSFKFNGNIGKQDLIKWYKNHLGKYAVYSDGKLMTDFIYDKCGSYAGGLMAVCQNDKWGYINKNGEIVIPIEYDASWKEYVPYENHKSMEMQEFCYAASDGYVVLCKDNKFELRDINGKEVIRPGIFEEIRPVYNGKCWVKKDGKWGVIEIGYK